MLKNIKKFMYLIHLVRLMISEYYFTKIKLTLLKFLVVFVKLKIIVPKGQARDTFYENRIFFEKAVFL